MADLNIALVEGMIVGGIEDRRTAKGFTIVKFRLLNTPAYNDKNGNEKERDQQTIEVQAFGERGEGMMRGLAEGDIVRVFGELSGREYQGKFYLSLNAQNVSRIRAHETDRPSKRVIRPAMEVETPDPDVPIFGTTAPTSGTPPPDDTDLPF